MQGLAYADLTRHRLTKSLGGSAFQFPDLIAGDEIRLGLRLAENLDGSAVEATRTVVSLKASVGFIDQRPTGGTFRLVINGDAEVEGTNLTTALAFDADASTIETALDALSAKPTTFTVTAVTGGFTVTLDDGSQMTDFAGTVIALDPISFVHVREFVVNGNYLYELRLVQAPLASTSAFDLIVPPAPVLAAVRDGGTDSGSGAAWNEVQSLTINPAFRGTYQIKRGFFKTDLLSVEDGPDEIEAALASLVGDEEDIVFKVTNPDNNVAHIEWTGDDGGGVDQALLTVEVFSAPPGDPTFVLDLNTHDLFAALRGATEIKPQLEIELVLDDENGGGEDFTVTALRQEIKIVAELNAEANTTAANVDWLRPPDGTRYQPYGSGQVITGSQHYIATIGDGLATTINIAHNLGSADLHVTLRDNVGGLLKEGADFDATVNGVNDIDLDFAAAPATDSLVVVITTAGPASAFQAHNHAIAEVTGLQALLDDLGLRLQTVEGLVPTGAISSSSASTGETIAKWKLPDLFEVYPKKNIALSAKTVSGIDAAELPRKGGRLLPAAFDTAPTDAAVIPASPVAGTVYKNTSGADMTLPGVGGIRSRIIKDSEFFAYDGEGFYQVENILASGAQWFTPTDYELFGTELIHLDLSAEDALFGPRGSYVGLCEVRGMSGAPVSIADGYYPYRTSSGGDLLKILDSSTHVAAGPAALPGGEMVRPIGANETFDVSQFVVSGSGTLVTLTVPGSDAHAPTGFKLFADLRGDFGASGELEGIVEITSIGSDQWTYTTSGSNDGTYTDAITCEMPGEVSTYANTTSLAGEINRFYPVDFRRELFRLHVNDKQFRLKTTLAIDFSLELAALLANTDAQWAVIVQTGEMLGDKLDADNDGEGPEVAGIRWNDPSLDQVVHLSGVPATHAFGLRVYRSASDVITCSRVLYGNEEGGARAPRSANFVVRAMLHRFDVGDYETEPTGLVAFSGLSVDESIVGEASIS